MTTGWLVVPLGAAIGYLTNYLAARMVFHWLLPRKEKALRRAVVERMMQFLPGYLKIPVLEERVRKELEQGLERQSMAELGRELYGAGGLDLRLIEALGGLIGAVVGLLALLL